MSETKASLLNYLVNNYEKILTHKIGDIAKNFALSLMLIVFVTTIYFPAGLWSMYPVSRLSGPMALAV